MTPEHFISTWKNNPLNERAGAQAHFDNLCDLLGVDKPRDTAALASPPCLAGQVAAENIVAAARRLNELREAWLDLAYKALDHAVAAAYGWNDYSPEMPDEEILRRLLALNLERAADASQP